MQSTEMITHNQRSDIVDPLVDYSTLSFFKQSLNLPSSSSTSNSSIFGSIKTNTKTRVLSSPHKLFKQTTTILEDNLDNSKADKTQPVFTENEMVPRKRRPALGLKRTKFSVKPMPSQPAVNLEPSIDFDKFTDPDELFTAFERMENAKKEVQRLKGEPLVDLDLNSVSLAPRRRRPSLLGRSATYRHRSYPSVSTAAVDDTLLSSQETTNIDMLSPSRSKVVPDATLAKNSSSMRVPDSKATGNSKVSELDELLSYNYEGLDEDGVQNLLRDKLQIKSVDIGKALLPDWRVPLRGSLTSSLALPKMDETVSRLHGANKAVSSKDKKSPAKPSSPLASISTLNKHIGKRFSSTNLFSSHYFDSSPTKSTNPSRESEKKVDQARQSEEVDAMKNLSNFRSPTHGEDVVVSGETSIISLAEDINPTNEPQDKEVLLGQSDDVDAMKNLPEGRRSPTHGEEVMVDSGEPSFDSVPKDMNPTCEPKEKEAVMGKSDQNGAKTGSCELERSLEYGIEDVANSGEDSFGSVEKDVDQASEPNKREIEVGKSDQIGTKTGSCEVGSSPGREEERAAASDIGLTVEPENQVNEQVAAAQESVRQELIIDESMENPSSNGGGMSEPLITENNPGEKLPLKMVGYSKRKLRHKGKPLKAPSDVPVSERTQAIASQSDHPDVPVSEETRPKRRKVEGARPGLKKTEKRFSLYNAGTKWEDGVRRSTRIRMRPLEYWNGERFLYGRVHNTLLTVIGVKYVSPSKEAEETEIKVKSFVSDEYKSLVERASLY